MPFKKLSRNQIEFGFWEAMRTVFDNPSPEIVTTANIREWRHIFKLRCDKAAHPQMRQVMLPLLVAFHERIPLLFDDLAEFFGPAMRQMPGMEGREPVV